MESSPKADIKQKLLKKRSLSRTGFSSNPFLTGSGFSKIDSINRFKALKKENQTQDKEEKSFDVLNKDVYDSILSYLPVIDVLNVSTLNKKFYDVVKTSSYWNRFSLQQQVLRFAQSRTEGSWIESWGTRVQVNLAYVPMCASGSAYDRYIFPLCENSIHRFFPQTTEMLSHPFINGDTIKDLDLTGVEQPIACLCNILKNSKFSNLQKLSVASFTRKFPVEVDYIDENESKEFDKKYQSYIATFSSVMNQKLPVLSKLTHLNLLGMTKLTTEVFVKIIPCFPALKMLVLTGCQLLRPTAVIEAIASHCPKLETVATDYTPISVQQLLRIKSLKVVLCDEIDHEEVFPFKEVSKDLVELMRDNTPVSLAQFAELLPFVSQPQLQSDRGLTVLFLACCEKKPPIEFIRLLLSLPNIDVNFVCNTRPVRQHQLFNPWALHFPWQATRETESNTDSGLSCLHQLMSHERLKSGSLSEIITLFLQHGADPYLIGNADHMSPLAIGVYRKAFGVVKDLMTNIPVGCDMNGETILHYLCKYYDSHSGEEFHSMIDATIHYGYDINTLSNNGYTALLYAAARNKRHLVRYLVAKGARVINTDYFHHFLWKNCTEVSIFETLYQNGLDLLYQVRGRTVLHQKSHIKPPHKKRNSTQAVNRAEIIKWILHKKEGKILAATKSPNPVLHTMVTNSLSDVRYEIVKALLKAGADPNELDSDGNTPLVVMCRRSDKSTLKMEKNEDSEFQMRESMFYQDLSEQEEQVDPMEYFMTHETPFTRMLKLLKSYGANLNATDSNGCSVAHSVGEITYGSKYLVPVLFKHGVDFTLRDKKHVTPLLRLAWTEKFQDLVTLLRNGVIPEQTYHPSGLTLLHALAQAVGHHREENEVLLKEVCTRTVASGININHQDVFGYTALHYCVTMRNEALCDFLLDLGADVSIKTNVGHTALMLGFMPGFDSYPPRGGDIICEPPYPDWSDHYENLKTALYKKMVRLDPTSVTALDKNSTNVLHCLARTFDSHNSTVVELIFKHSTKEMINQQDKEGNTPLHYALARYNVASEAGKKTDNYCSDEEEKGEEEKDDEEDKQDDDNEENEPGIGTFHVVLKGLLAKGAKLNILNKNLETPCHLYCDLPDSVKDSCKRHFLNRMTENDWKIQDSEGDTVLHKLARSGNLNLCSTESLQIADSSIINYSGRTPLHEACYNPSKALLTLLKLPSTNLSQQEAVSKRTPLAILLRQYTRRPTKKQTALAIQFLLNHENSSKMMTAEIAELATPELMEQIKGVPEEKERQLQMAQPRQKIRFMKILQKPQKRYEDKYDDSDEEED